MKRAEANVWQASLLFLSAFKSLQYKNIPLPFLLLRSFQKYYLKSLKRDLAMKNKLPLKEKQLQQKCQPFLIPTQPDWKREGKIIVRSQLYFISKGVSDKEFLFIAHHRREYHKMKKYRGCSPLIYFPGIRAVVTKNERRRILKAYRRIVKRKSIPAVFRSRRFQSWLLKCLINAMKDIRRWQHLFKKYTVSTAIYGSTINKYGAVMSAAAQQQRIPVVNLQHGILGQIGHLPVNADVNALWGESHRQFLLKHGADPAKMVITGPLFYRNIEKQKGTSAAWLKNRSRLRVLVAMQPLGSKFNTRMINTLERAVQPLRNKVQIIYKLHPDQQNSRSISRLLRLYRSKSRILKHGNLPLVELINHSQLIITPFSSVAYEAALLNKPVLFYGRKPYVYYFNSKPRAFYNVRKARLYFKKSLTGRFIKNWSQSQVLHDVQVVQKDAASQLWTSLKKLKRLKELNSDQYEEVDQA